MIQFNQISFIGANPGAGNNFTITVPGGTSWRLICIHFLLSTGVAVANRIKGLVITKNGVSYKFYSTDISAASSTEDFTAWPCCTGTSLVAFSVTSHHSYIGIPDFTLTANDTIASNIFNIQAADVINQIFYTVEIP
jgi:hypothetical protein